MDPHALIAAYGYWVVAFFCLLEGETVLVVAGFMASRGHLDIAVVMLIAAVAGFVGDQIFFWLGRHKGPLVLARFPAVAQQAARVFRLIERYQAWVVVGVRFAYGLRIAGPIIIGVSAVPSRTFVVFNAIGAIIWAILVAGVGYLFGEAANRIFGEAHDIEIWLLIAIIAVAFIVMLVQRKRSRRQDPTAEDD